MQPEPRGEVIVRAFLRAWRLDAFLAFAVMTAMLLAVLPRHEFVVPGRDGAMSVIWPLVPTALAIPVPMVVDRRHIELHGTSPRVLVQRLRVLLVLAGTASVIVAVEGGLDVTVLARNTVALLGLGLLGGTLLSRSVSWCLLALAPMAMWLLGTRRDQLAYPWAFLLRPGGDHRAMGVAVTIFSVGAMAFCVARKAVRGRP